MRRQRFSNRTVAKRTFEKAKQMKRQIPKDRIEGYQREEKYRRWLLQKIKIKF